jgi:hypothetical protein
LGDAQENAQAEETKEIEEIEEPEEGTNQPPGRLEADLRAVRRLCGRQHLDSTSDGCTGIAG